MPGFNQMGPIGQGPMTGRKMGKCTNFGAKFKNNNNSDENVNEANVLIGQGRGRRFNNDELLMGRGFRHRNRFRGGF